MNVNISHNQVQNGIEISFDTKPEKEIINWLKYNKYRWNRVKQVWWKKYNYMDWDAAHKYFENPDSHETSEIGAEQKKKKSYDPRYFSVSLNLCKEIHENFLLSFLEYNLQINGLT